MRHLRALRRLRERLGTPSLLGCHGTPSGREPRRTLAGLLATWTERWHASADRPGPHLPPAITYWPTICRECGSAAMIAEEFAKGGSPRRTRLSNVCPPCGTSLRIAPHSELRRLQLNRGHWPGRDGRPSTGPSGELGRTWSPSKMRARGVTSRDARPVLRCRASCIGAAGSPAQRAGSYASAEHTAGRTIPHEACRGHYPGPAPAWSSPLYAAERPSCLAARRSGVGRRGPISGGSCTHLNPRISLSSSTHRRPARTSPTSAAWPTRRCRCGLDPTHHIRRHPGGPPDLHGPRAGPPRSRPGRSGEDVYSLGATSTHAHRPAAVPWRPSRLD